MVLQESSEAQGGGRYTRGSVKVFRRWSLPPPDLTPDPSPISHPSNRERGAPSHPRENEPGKLPPLPGDGREMGEGGRGG
jgi:hypothetical protein